MNVIRGDNAIGMRSRGGRNKGRSQGKHFSFDLLPKYRLDSEFQKQSVNLHSSSTILKTPTTGLSRRGRGTSTSSFLASTPHKSSLGSTNVGTTPASSSTAVDSYCVVAITSGRGDARGEIGMAAIDLQYPHVILCQISDCQTYVNTLTKIYFFDPVEILMPDTMCIHGGTKNKLSSLIKEKFPQLNVTPISRMHFNESAGLERVRTHCSEEYSTVELFVKQKYYALAAVAALLKYIEYIQHIVYAPNSMRMEFQGSQNTTVIDIESAQSLELVTSQSNKPNITLLGTLNRCLTPMGKRLLRASILQPLCDMNLILSRQSCVAELVCNRSLRETLQPIIRRLSGAERLLSLSVQRVQSSNMQSAEYNLNYILLLKNCLDIVPELRIVLANGNAAFFKNACKNLENQQFQVMKSKILDIIHSDARSVMGYSSSNMQRCFAIKTGINDLLDIARQTYCELIDDMKTMVEDLSVKYKLPLSLACNASLGYHIQADLPRRMNTKVSDFPADFIEVKKSRNCFTMSTSALLVLSQQCKISCEELHIMSNVLLYELLVSIREHIGCLFQLSADIAELDLILSLAYISSTPGYVKPTFGLKLELENSIHPIMEVFGTERPVPNDVRASDPKNFHTITGPNMSGKSVYLKQIVLLHIMAQIGCYVPATKAEFRIADRILCRICFRDDMECNASTFVVEMKEMQYTLQSITPKSLVILDELCRGTTVEEGSSIAWAICERLLITTAFTFNATHFFDLTKLADFYYNATNHCFETTTRVIEGSNDHRLIYTHKLKVGIGPTDNYGITLAELTGLPKSIIVKAREYAALQIQETRVNKDIGVDSSTWERSCYDCVAKMYMLLINNQFTRKNIVDLMKDIDFSNAKVPLEASNVNECIQTMDKNFVQETSRTRTTDSNSIYKIGYLEEFSNKKRRIEHSSILQNSNSSSQSSDWHNILNIMSPCSSRVVNEIEARDANLTFVDLNETHQANLLQDIECHQKHTLLFSQSSEKENNPETVSKFSRRLFELSEPEVESMLNSFCRSQKRKTAGPSKIGDTADSSQTMTITSQVSLPQSMNSSMLYEYLLSDNHFQPTFSNASIATEVAEMNARKTEAEIFKIIEGDAFNERGYGGSVPSPILIDMNKANIVEKI